MKIYYNATHKIAGRFKVERNNNFLFKRYSVYIGEGCMPVVTGSKRFCEKIAQALLTSCLDGAYLAYMETTK